MLMRRWALWWLALALLVAPALGHMHRIVHGPQAHTAHAHVQAQHGHAHAHGVADLFVAHDDDSTCRLFDQLTHSDALPALPALALPLLLVPFLFRRFERNAVSRRAALFDARGPPALR
jgi:hypothetical protein